MTVLLTLVGGGARGAGIASGPSSPPEGLAHDLKLLDDQLDATIRKVRNGTLKGSAITDAARSIRVDMFQLVDAYFPDVWGLSFLKVLRGFTAIDNQLTDASNSSFYGASHKRSADALDKAVEAQEELSATLKGHPDVPPAVLTRLRKLGQDTAQVAKRARSGAFDKEELSDRVRVLVREKFDLIKDNTKGIEVFGQPYFTVFKLLDEFDGNMIEVQLGLPFGEGPTKHQAVDHLDSARFWKRHVEAALVPKVSSIGAVFIPKGEPGACENTEAAQNNGETCYGVAGDNPPPAPFRFTFAWHLEPPLEDGTCTKFHALAGAPLAKTSVAVWHHGDEDGCNHGVEGPDGHEGTVWVEVNDEYWNCVAVYLGTVTNTDPGGPPAVCFPGKNVVMTVVKARLGSPALGDGSVTSSPAGIDCGPSCKSASAGFDKGATVTLTAAPDGSSTFQGWTGGGCSGTDPCTVQLAKAQTVMATFRHT